MAKKGPSMKSFKKLFSRSDAASLNESAEKHEREKKRFKFPTLKTKTKSGSDKSLNGSQPVLSDVESRNAAEDGEAWANDVTTKNKRFSLYGTAPRSKDKDISYSELDLRKPKRFATFSFGFKKKKKDDVSKSTFGLHSHGIEEQEDLGQMKLHQTNTKRFSMSEPELDTSGAFNIPSPPPVANNQSESYFTLTGQRWPVSQERLANGVDIHEEPRRAPIAEIPEVQLDDADPSDEKEVPNGFKSASTHPEIPPEGDDQSGPGLHPAHASSISPSNNDPDIDVQLSDKFTAQSDSPKKADTSYPAYSKENPILFGVTDSTPENNMDHLVNIAVADPEVSLSDRTSTFPETAGTSGVSKAPLSPEVVYGTLYNTLFPQNFTTEVLSSLSKASKVQTEVLQLENETVIETLECRTEADATHSHATTSRDSHDTVDGFVKPFEGNCPQIHDEMTPTKKEMVMIKTFSERHSDSILYSNDSESANQRMNSQEPEVYSPEIKKPVMVKALNEITSESNVVYANKTWQEPESTTGVGGTAGKFITIRKTAAEVSPKRSPPETKKAVMVKTLCGPSTETEARNSLLLASRDSDSSDHAMEIPADVKSFSRDKMAEETDHGTKKPAIMIKTHSEIHMESSIILSPKATLGELDWTIGNEIGGNSNFPQIAPDIEHESEILVLVKTLDENQTETIGTHESFSIVQSAKYDHDCLDSDETNSPQTLELTAVTALPSWISNQSDSSISGEPTDTTSPRVLSNVQCHEINNENHFLASSSHETENTSGDDFPVVSQHSAETLNILTQMEKPDLIKSLRELNTNVNAAGSHSVYRDHDTIRWVSVIEEAVVSSDLERNPEGNGTDVPDSSPQHVDSGDILPSQLSRSHSEGKSDLAPGGSGSVPVSTNTAPPITDCATSQKTGTQITHSEQREILPEQLLREEASADTSGSSLKGKIWTESSSDRPRHMDWIEGSVSPSYLSIGSEDGTTVEVYYSAEEGDEGESEEELFDTRPESVSTGGGEAGRPGDTAGSGEVLTDAVGLEQDRRKTEGIHFEVDEGEKVASSTREGEMRQLLSGARSVKDATAADLKKEGEEVRKEPLATPVQQVNTLLVCDLAPPCEEECSMNLETEDQTPDEKRLPSPERQGHSDNGSTQYTTVDDKGSEQSATSDPEGGEQGSPHEQSDKRDEVSHGTESSAIIKGALTPSSAGAEVVGGNVTHGAEQSDASPVKHNSEWADPISQGDGTLVEVAVEPPEPHADANRPDSEAAEAVQERQQVLDKGFLTASVISENLPTGSDTDSKMNSGYSSFSTRLTLRTSAVPKDDESKLRIHKVSLIKDDDGADMGRDTALDTVDFSESDGAGTEPSESDYNLEYKWKNRFEGVSQYVPKKTEDSTLSLSYRISESSFSDDPSSSSYSFTLPEATADKHQSARSSPPPEDHFVFAGRLIDRAVVEQPVEEPWRRSFLVQEEPDAPAQREREAEGESEEIKSDWDSEQLPVFSFSSAQPASDSVQDDDSQFTGLFKATLVQLVPDPVPPPSTPPASPDDDFSSHSDMESLVDTLKNMGPSVRPRGMLLRPPAPTLMSSLPPIVEDATSPIVADVPDSSGSPVKQLGATSPPSELCNGQSMFPADLGLRRNTRDLRSPLTLMKQSQEQQMQPGARNLSLHVQTPTTSTPSTASSDSSTDEVQPSVLNANGVSPAPTSRLDNSVLFGSYRSSSIDQELENGVSHRPLFRTGSLPDTGIGSSRISAGPKELGEPRVSSDLAVSRSERLSFLLNASSSSTGSLPESDDLNSRISRPPSLSHSSPATNTTARVLTASSSLDLPRSLPNTDTPLSKFGQLPGIGSNTGTSPPPLLQRALSSESPTGSQSSIFGTVTNQFQTAGFQFQTAGSQFQTAGSQFQTAGSQFQTAGSHFHSPEPDRTILSKYRAFPDAYLTKEKEHGKLNPRPGKMYIFDRAGMCGQRLEIRGDIVDATSWDLQEIISIRVIRGGWVLYEEPNFKGEKFALDEGDIELTCPFSSPEEQQQNGEKSEEETKPARRFIIGSIRRAVRDYSVPDISLFPEENAEGKKVIFRDTSEDARIFGFPIKANSIIINAGLWLVYGQPFFQGVPRVLEVGGYTNPASWGVEQPYVGSLHPLKIGEPRVENVSEPKMVIYDKPYFSGRSRTINLTTRDFMTRVDRQQTAFMYSVGSLKVLGGIWVGYEKEGFRGHQYLLEEGEYHDWRVWGGCNSELRSVRVIRADFSDPLMVMFEQPEEDQAGVEENSFEVTEAIPDVELFEYKTSTRSIHVLSGAWIAYSHVDFSGNQYILEKGFYNNCADWGSADTRICSVQPILLAPSDSLKNKDEILLYSEPDFQGESYIFNSNQETLPEKLSTKSCRVAGGSWVLYENDQFAGNMVVLSEGDYPNLTSMGCGPERSVRSIKVVPMMFSVPSISLFGLEGLEGREITTENEMVSMVEEGFNNHVLSVRVNTGCWVLCEYSNYRGRQFLLEPIEVTNWLKFSSLNSVGSMYPVRQKRRFFRVKNKETGNYLSIQGGVEEMKSGRVVAAPQVEPMSNVWYYQDGLLKNKLAPNMALQVMGNVEAGVKVILWTETRQPIQIWTAQMAGLITSITFPGFVLDVKGGKSYDKDHVVVMPESDERPSQQWNLELL